MSIYIHTDVQKVQHLHQSVLQEKEKFSSPYQFLDALAYSLFEGLQLKKSAAAIELSNYHPAYLGKTEALILNQIFTLEDARLSIAREFGYSDWEMLIEQGQIPIDQEFEKAVDLLLAGDLQSLQQLLSTRPTLIMQHSNFGHNAQLIHYVGANGVELWRQVVPSNIVEVTRFLLKCGALPDVKANIYGGSTPLALISSSAHPEAAGLMQALTQVFHTTKDQY